jgi:tetratricopeptide (TPR) repeat protein
VSPTDHAARARALLDANRSEDAIRELHEGLSRDPHSAELLHLLAQACSEAGQREDAYDAAQSAVAEAPEWGDAHRVLAVAALGVDQREVAARAAATAVRLEPDDPTAWFAKTLADVAGQRYLAARESARRVAELAPAAGLGRHALGYVALRAGDTFRASQHYREALAIEPNNPAYLNNLGVALEREGEYLEAADYFERAAKLDVRDSKYLENAAKAARAHVRGARAAGVPARFNWTWYFGFWFVARVALSAVSDSVGLTIMMLVLAGAIAIGIVRAQRRRRDLSPGALAALETVDRRARAWRRLRVSDWALALVVILLIGGVVAIVITGDGHDDANGDDGPAVTTTSFDVRCAMARVGLFHDENGMSISPEALGCPPA